MNRVSFGESACERTRKYLDSYISNELLVETNHDVLRHLESCRECAAEADARARLRERLRGAVRSQSAPVELPALVREKIRTEESRKTSGFAWARWSFVGAGATLAACAVLWVNFASEPLPAIGDRPAQNAYIQKISARMSAVLKVGLGDHLHCSVFRRKSKNVPAVAQMEKELGPSFKGLLPVVGAAVPQGYRIVMAHRCGYLKRDFIHLTLEKDGSLMSLVITRKQDGETLEGLAPATTQGGVPMYQSAAAGYRVAAFDAGSFFAYVVSDLRPKANLQVASAMAPAVRDLLMRTPA
jgi:predicted anti-sigma-YlaC factor YlaD